MGKGDKRTRRGKIFNGSFGKKRQKSKKVVKQKKKEHVPTEPASEN